MGKAGLTGMRGRLGERVAESVSARSRFDEDQIKALIGGILLAISVYRLVKLIRDALRAGRGEPIPA